MPEDHSLEQLFKHQQKMNDNLIKIQKRTQILHSDAEEQHTKDHRGPVYDLYQIGDVLHLELEVPGVLEKDILVDLTPDYLEIAYKIEEPLHVEEKNFLIHKRKRGKSEYTFNLPLKNMTTRIPPQISEGVLYLELQVEAPISNEE